MTTRSSGLEALLDDALEDFVLGSESRTGGAEESCLQKEDDELQKGTKETFSKSEDVVPKILDPRLEEPAKSMAFDPLGRSTGSVKGKGRKAAAKFSQRESQVEQMNQPFAGDSMSRLLSELAKATQGTDSVPPPGQSTDAQLSATLRALADQTPSNSVSGEGGPASRAANSQEDIILEQLSAQLHAAFQTDPEQSTGEGDLPGMSSLVDTIMQQLLSKDVLYQPMKDIGGRYPEWIEAHRGELSPEDITKYEEQYEYIQRICTLYETNPKDYSHLMDLLNEMQQRGQPPQEIIDELAPGMTFGPDGIPQSSSLPGNDGECCVQ